MSARHTRRRTSRPFLSKPLDMLEHPSYASLSPVAVKLLEDIARKYNGRNNGELDAPYGELIRQRHFKSRHTIARALRELTDAGFVLRTRQGRQFGGIRAPSLYAITWQPVAASNLHTYVFKTAPRLWQVQSAGAPGALVKPKQVPPEHLRASKRPFPSEPDNAIMRVLQVHLASEQVHLEHYLSISMPGGRDFNAWLLEQCGTGKQVGCVPIGSAPLAKYQSVTFALEACAV